jgi:leucine dehydrogenase
MFQQLTATGVQELHFFNDPATGLQAIIAIHSTKLGPALGGCRHLVYSSPQAAIEDACRLAKAMSYKAALAGLELGGGKAVLLRPPTIADHRAYFTRFGHAINHLGGRYLTAMDSGTEVKDMDVIADATSFVVSSSDTAGDPSPSTAVGVLAGIKAAAAFQLGRNQLKGLKVAIQGVGHVGYVLAQLLHQQGAQLIVADSDADKTARCQQELAATVVTPEAIYQTNCDVFAPCGLGGIINDQTINQLKCAIVAGGANNQLAEPRYGLALQRKGILYAPDYIINAGGLIYIAMQRQQQTQHAIDSKLATIGNTLTQVFTQAQQRQLSTHAVANQMAEEILNSE